MTIPGRKWGDILEYAPPTRYSYPHGQCRSVGVSWIKTLIKKFQQGNSPTTTTKICTLAQNLMTAPLLFVFHQVAGYLLGGGVNWLGTYNKYGYAAEQVQPKILQRKNAAVKELTPWKLIEGVENEGGDRQWHNPRPLPWEDCHPSQIPA